MSERPEVSKKNRYFIEKHRYYELKHFCLQYPIWKKAKAGLDGLKPSDVALVKGHSVPNPEEELIYARDFYFDRMDMVEKAARQADPELYEYLMLGVTEELCYDILRIRFSIPCCRECYYQTYRKFFYILNKLRG